MFYILESMFQVTIHDIASIPLNGKLALKLMIPYLLFLGGIVVYSIFVFHFYRYLARKDIFKFDLTQYNNSHFLLIRGLASFYLYILKYLVVFPIFVSFWSLFLAVLIIFLSDSQSVETTLLISVSLVSAIRITAYYNRELSVDLAKMLPFALLGVFILDVNFFSLDVAIKNILTIPSYYIKLIYYFLFIVFLEFMLRALTFVISLFKSEPTPEPPEINNI